VTRGKAILLGLVTGALVAAAAIFLVARLARREGTPPPPGGVPAHLRSAASPPPGAPSLAMVDVTWYARAAGRRALVPVPGRIVDFPSPGDRARELVRLVLDGPSPSSPDAVRPAPPGVEYREVFLDPRGIAWVDFRGKGPWARMGSDEEQALLACLARTLVRGIPGVRRVGFLVEGETRRTLAGHVDLSRTWTGEEWPAIGEDVPAAGDGSAADNAGDGSGLAGEPAGLPGGAGDGGTGGGPPGLPGGPP